MTMTVFLTGCAVGLGIGVVLGCVVAFLALHATHRDSILNLEAAKAERLTTKSNIDRLWCELDEQAASGRVVVVCLHRV